MALLDQHQIKEGPFRPVDRRRQFTLPDINQLSKDQEAARALPLEGQHLIVGGPGTGKSVVALLRARRLAEERKKYFFLTYNHLLRNSNRHIFGNQLSAYTLERWFRRLWQFTFDQKVPLCPPSRNGFQAIDWQEVSRFLGGEGSAVSRRNHKPTFLVIDEGQDMPPDFYDALIDLEYHDLYVVADQNQQIEPKHCSSRHEIEDALGIDAGLTLELNSNYRNTRPIALLAQHFYPNDPASPKPDLPPSRPGASRPEMWSYGDVDGRQLQDIAEYILQAADRTPKKLFGIITPDDRIRVKFFEILRSVTTELDHGRSPIWTYKSGETVEIDFGSGGIVVINGQSSKGLEFDVTILADIDAQWPRGNQAIEILKKKFYVMVARAREQIIILRTGVRDPIIDGLLPDDETILAKK